MLDWIRMTNELGPEKIVHVYDPQTGMKGVVVIDTMLMGMAGGGTRMMPDITTEEIFGLARAMTYKFAALDLPIGGAKAGIWADPAIEGKEREEICRAFGRAIKPLFDAGLAVGPDIGTHGKDVEDFYIGAQLPPQRTGLGAQEIEGEPLENLATGYGVAVSTKAACEVANLDIQGASVAVEGFGKAGSSTVRYLANEGARLVAVSTIKGTLYNPDGLDVEKLLELRNTSGDNLIEQYEDAQKLRREEIYELPVEILIPGARPYVIDQSNVDRVQARVISSVANIPITEEAEEILFQRKIYSVPDFISNAGGVVVALVDFLGGNAQDVFKVLKEVLASNTRKILVDSLDQRINPQRLSVKQTTKKVLEIRESGQMLSFEEIMDRVKTSFKLT